MSTFKNVSGVDLEVRVDGLRKPVAADATFKVADEFDYTLENQPAFQLVKSTKSDPEPASVTEGAK